MSPWRRDVNVRAAPRFIGGCLPDYSGFVAVCSSDIDSFAAFGMVAAGTVRTAHYITITRADGLIEDCRENGEWE